VKSALFGLTLLAALPAQASTPLSVTLSFGLEEIHDRSLLPLTVESLALEGLNGLASLDPAFDAVKTPEHRLQLRYGEQPFSSYALPPPEDALGWASLLERAARQAGRKSAAIGHADQDQITQAIFDSLMTKLDVFSHYAGPAEARERRASRSGFGGIGVRFDKTEDGIVLTEVMPDSPALQAKLKVGDLVSAIDGEALAGLDQNVISQKLRGPIASSVKLTLSQGPITLHRALIVTPTVTSHVEKDIGVIAVSGFNDNTGVSVAEAVKKAKATSGLKGIILDLRGNPGGLLDQGLAVADVFIAQGKLLTTRGRHPDAYHVYEAKGGDPGEGLPLVVLVDGRTASAAEVAAAALQDSGRAVLVGTNSFGKGIIQTVWSLPNEGEISFTWSRFFVPSGYALHGLGVLPAICTAGGSPAGDKLLADGRAAPAAMFAAWRATPVDDMARRSKLRSHCLAEDHSHSEIDLAIAKHLLSDPALYAKALAVAGPVTTASFARALPSANRN
jgi:carboxyl-terminal processing protease